MTNVSPKMRMNGWRRSLKIADQWPQLSLCILTVLAFLPLKFVILADQHIPATRLWLFAALCLAALFFFRLRTSDLPRVARLTLWGIGLLFALYLSLAYPSVLLEEGTERVYFELTVYRWAGATLFCLALWQPAWMIPALAAARFQKVALSEVAGMSISPTDYMPVIEFGCLLVLGACLLWLGRRWLDLWREEENAPDSRLAPLEAVYLTAVAVHFANYYYSAVQKIAISDPWWQWVVENPTQYLTLAAWERGNLPLTILGEAAAATLAHGIIVSVVALNVFTLATQLAAVPALLRIRWIILVTALYDLSHFAIFLLSGIFFYKWIWLNLLIVGSLSLIATKPLTRHMQVWLIAVLLLAPNVFFVARLGWFDTPSFNDEYVEAVTADGSAYRVPDNYFLAASVTHAQQRLVAAKPGHFLTGAYGAHYERSLPLLPFHDALNCRIDIVEPGSMEEAIARRNLDDYIRAHHRFVESRLDDQGRLLYDLYPHHIFSMPWESSDFHALDKRQIVGYRYVVESKCIRLVDGRPYGESLARAEYYVPVDE